MLIGLAILVFLLSFFLFYASYSISAGIYIKSLCINANNTDSVALTFDDGIDPIITPKVLDILQKYKAKASFFIIGENINGNELLLKRIIEEGHSVGNHSYRHKWYFPMQTTKTIYKEITDCTEAITKAIGSETKLETKFFRPPFGVANPMIAKAVKRAGLISVGWSIRSFDTMGQDIEKVKKRVLNQLKPGKVILLHDNRDNAEILVEELLEEIKKQGLKSVTIDKLFNLE